MHHIKAIRFSYDKAKAIFLLTELVRQEFQMATRTIPYGSTSPRAPLRSVPGKLWVVACTMLRVRSTRRLLAEMEPRMLSDIGLSHGQAHREASRAFWDVDTLR